MAVDGEIINAAINPFDQTSAPFTVSFDILRVVGDLDPNIGLKAIRTGQAIFQESPSSVTVTPIDNIVDNNPTGPAYTEVFSGTPGVNQYRVDYGDPTTGHATGIIWFNVAQDTQAVRVNCKSVGSVLERENIGAAGSGGGAAGVNYVQNGTSEGGLAGWSNAASGNLVVQLATIGGEVLDGNSSFAIEANGLVTADTDYITVALDQLAEGDINTGGVFSLIFKGITTFQANYLKFILRDTANNIDIPISPTFLPGGKGHFNAVFNFNLSDAYELRIVSNISSQAFRVVVDRVFLGIGVASPTAIVGTWVSYTPGNTQGFGTIASAQFLWRRVGESIDILAYWVNGTVAASEAQIALPFSTVDAVLASPTVVGKVFSDSAPSNGIIAIATGGDSYLNFCFDAAGAIVGQNGSAIAITGGEMSFLATGIPLTLWQGAGVISLEGPKDIVSNSDLTDTNSGSGTSVQGSSLVPSITGSDKYKEVTLSRAFRYVRLEIQPGGTGPWSAISGTQYETAINFGTTRYGISWTKQSDTVYRIYFGRAGYFDVVTAAAVTWPAEAANLTRWRFVGSDDPTFGEAPKLVKRVIIAFELNNSNNGGATSGSWRDWLTDANATAVLYDPGNYGFCTLTATGHILAPGIYAQRFMAAFYKTNKTHLRMFNVTDVAAENPEALSTEAFTSLDNSPPTIGEIFGLLSASKEFKMQYRVGNTRAGDGLGLNNNWTGNNVFGKIIIDKYG